MWKSCEYDKREAGNKTSSFPGSTPTRTVTSQANLSNALQYFSLAIVRLLSPVWGSCGVESKAYLDKLNGRAACIIEGRSIGAEDG